MTSPTAWQQGFGIDFKPSVQDTTFVVERTLNDMYTLFADPMSAQYMLDQGINPVIYTFQTMDAPQDSGALSFGITTLHAGTIGDEYYMTKGHYHTIRHTAEVYYTLSGSGLMQTENEEGVETMIEMRPGQAAYVAPGFAHRMINTGSVPLISFYVFRADAGHDYQAITNNPFYHRVVRNCDKVYSLLPNEHSSLVTRP